MIYKMNNNVYRQK